MEEWVPRLGQLDIGHHHWDGSPQGPIRICEGGGKHKKIWSCSLIIATPLQVMLHSGGHNTQWHGWLALRMLFCIKQSLKCAKNPLIVGISSSSEGHLTLMTPLPQM